ncbi:hypothetical protein FBU30_000868 [Linnemannia zychae]|nr:hypothetical protein FBU30_000868 [Linnemannia zychae]
MPRKHNNTSTNIANSGTPLDIPELRHRISRFVTPKDAYSCARVSKAWAGVFIAALWHKIDFTENPKFANLSPGIVSKYGRHIRIVLNITTDEQISALANVSVCQLKRLEIRLTGSAEHNDLVTKIFQRNIYNLTKFDANIKGYNNLRSSPLAAVILIPPPEKILTTTTLSLISLTLSEVHLNHCDLVTILRTYPLLNDLSLSLVELKGNLDTSFKHTHIKKLSASLPDVFPADSTLSLLTYFPNLTCLGVRFDKYWDSSINFKDWSDQCCPLLTEYELLYPHGEDLVYHTFIEKDIRMHEVLPSGARRLKSRVADIIKLHAVLKEFTVASSICFETDKVSQIQTSHDSRSYTILQIPTTCSKLEKLDLWSFEIDMCDIDDDEWICKDLKDLRMRIRKLNTKERIVKAIELWRSGSRERRKKQAMDSRGGEKKVEIPDRFDISLEARVARHLLKFEKLEKVWLGYQTWTLV